jgi:serine/threonine protein kinase
MTALRKCFVCESVLGQGGFSTVYRARHTFAPVRIAIKQINEETLKNEEDRARLMREIDLHRRMDHPFIAKLFFVADQNEQFAIAEESAPP